MNRGAAWLKGAIPLLALILINVICFSRTLNGYFLADDFVHVAFLHRVFQGHGELLWQNFFTNWMQTQGTQFYRPLISLTLALDYLLYGAQGWGFHLSNTIYQIASSIFLYLFVRRLLHRSGANIATWAAFLTAALFSAFPLHCEVVSWIIGRVDSVCTTFYFASLWLFMRWYQDKGKASLGLSLVSFALSLCSKEMAITVPPVLSLVCFMEAPGGMKQKVSEALKATCSFWLMLFAYLGMRTVFLGTISGGYTGSIGEGLSQSLYSRWFGGESFSKVIYPFNEEVAAGKLRRTLMLIYGLALGLFSLRLVFFKKLNPFNKYFAFAIAWFVLAMLPTYQVFNITQNLQGSRFIYLGSAPLCLFFVLLVMPLVQNVPLRSVQGLGRVLSQALLFALVICFCQITYKNNIPWAHASNELRHFRQAIETETHKLKPKEKLIVFNLPQRNSGAHMLYNAAMLSVLLEPPLSPSRISGQVVTFEPMTYGDSNLIIVSRLRKLMRQPELYSAYEWDSAKHALLPVTLVGKDRSGLQPKESKLLLSSDMEFDSQSGSTRSGNTQDGIVPSKVSGNLCLDSGPLEIDCLDIDFIDVEIAYSPQSKTKNDPYKPYVMLFWANEKEPLFDGKRLLAETISGDGKFHRCRFSVSQNKSWLKSGSVNALRLAWTPGDYKLAVNKISASSGGIAQLETEPGSFVEEIDGVYRLLSSRGLLNYDLSSIPQAVGCIVEISKPNSWFEHYSGHYRETALSGQALKVLPLYKNAPDVKGQFAIEQSMFPISGYYQVRVAAVNDKGEVAGYVSDPINMQVAVLDSTAGGSGRASHQGNNKEGK